MLQGNLRTGCAKGPPASCQLGSLPISPGKNAGWLGSVSTCVQQHQSTGRSLTHSASTKQPLVEPPPASYNFREAIQASSRQYVEQYHPELIDLVDNGSLVVYKRPEDYVERRTDGYQEPLLVFVIGTAHVSERSAADVTRLVQAVRPDNVVVELCRSRTAILSTALPDSSTTSNALSSSSSRTNGSGSSAHVISSSSSGTATALSSSSQSSHSSSMSGSSSACITADVNTLLSTTSSSHLENDGGHSSSNGSSAVQGSSSDHTESQSGSSQILLAVAADSGSSTDEDQLAQPQLPHNVASVSSPVPNLGATSSGALALTSGSSPSGLRNSMASNSSLPAVPTLSSSNSVNAFNLSGGSFLESMQRAVRLGGQSGLVLRLLLAALSRQVAGKLNVQAGSEFAAARIAAEAIGAQIVLGDRPIEITLQRAWAALPLASRIQLCSSLLMALVTGPPKELNQAMIERLKEDDAISTVFSQLSTQYPELLGPLVHERDAYLAWSLKRSKAVNGCKTVVGVVGKGHLRGIVWSLMKDSHGLRFSDLVDGRNSRKVRQAELRSAVGRLVLETALLAGLYYVWAQYYGVVP